MRRSTIDFAFFFEYCPFVCIHKPFILSVRLRMVRWSSYMLDWPLSAELSKLTWSEVCAITWHKCLWNSMRWENLVKAVIVEVVFACLKEKTSDYFEWASAMVIYVPLSIGQAKLTWIRVHGFTVLGIRTGSWRTETSPPVDTDHTALQFRLW